MPARSEAEAEALFALVRARYGERLTEAQLAELWEPSSSARWSGRTAPGSIRLKNSDAAGPALRALPSRRVTDEVVFAPVRALAEGVRTRRLSPVALAELFLGRLERLGPRKRRRHHRP